MRRFLEVWLLALVLMFVLFGCGNADKKNAPVPASPVGYDYTTTTKQVVSQNISAVSGGVVQVTDQTSAIAGVKLTIPAGALSSDTTITAGEVNNPPALPVGLNFVGVPIDFGPTGTTFANPATVEIPFSDLAMNVAGASSKVDLKLYYFDKSTQSWSEAKILSIDTVNNVVIGQLNHFSYYAVTGLTSPPPQNLGTPQPGDLLYRLTFAKLALGWIPGHVGIYTGEKAWNGIGIASADVQRCKKYNVVEAISRGIQYSYYKIPNTTETCSVSTGFEGDSIYMGAREPKDVILTQQQRDTIVGYVEAQVGKAYTSWETKGIAFGLLSGAFVKGPNDFNCVGLAEKAYEVAGVNGGDGLVSGLSEVYLLTPAEQYNHTKPAGGVNPVLMINSATLTPSSGTDCTKVLAQISIFHTYGPSYIDSVTYVADNGFTNPNININDAGINGDVKAGDGIYSALATAGGDPSKGSLGLTFTVTDKSGKSASTRLVYTYTGTCTATAATASKQIQGVVVEVGNAWAR